MNKAFLIGRLTKEPELKYTASNVAIVNFSIAIDRQYTNEQGEKETDFINIVAFKKQAENVKKYVTKGSLVAIDGRIQTRNYDDKDGKKVYVTEVLAERVQFLNSKNSSDNEPKEDDVKPENFEVKKSNPSNDVFADFGTQIEITDEDIAF